MNTQELFEQISGLYETAKENHEDKSKAAKAKLDQAVLEVTRTRGTQGGKQHKEYEQALDEAKAELQKHLNREQV